MKVNALILDDGLTAVLGREDVLKKWKDRYSYLCQKENKMIEIDVSDGAIKKAFRHETASDRKKRILGTYREKYRNSWGELEEYTEGPLCVVFDSYTYDRINNRLKTIIYANANI